MELQQARGNMKSTAILLLVFLLIFMSDCYPMKVVQGKTNPGIRLRVTNKGLQYGKHPESAKRKPLRSSLQLSHAKLQPPLKFHLLDFYLQLSLIIP